MTLAPRVALALCASGPTFSVAVRTVDGKVSELEVEGRRQNAELTALIDRVLLQHGLRPADIGELRVDRGPGSYTGLRTAITFVRVLAAFSHVQVRAATSLELLALAAWERGLAPRDRPVRPILDARRGRAYTARVEWTSAGVRASQPPSAVATGSLADIVCGDETVLLAAACRAWLPDSTRVIDPPPAAARDLFHIALPCEPIELDHLEPLYLMGSYAESPAGPTNRPTGA